MPNWTARNLAGLVHGWSGTWQDRDGWPEVWPGRRKEAGGPDWRVAAQKLEKWRPIPVSGAARIWERPGVGAMRPENWKSAAAGSVRRQQTTGKSVFKYQSIVLKTAYPSTPRSAAPGCLFCRRPLTRRRPAADPPPSGTARLCRLPRRSLLPAGLSGVPPRRRRPAVPLVAPSVAAASAGCCAGLFFPPAIPIDPPVSPFAGPPRRTGGVCLPFGRNGGRKCRSRLEYCAEFPSFVTPKHQYHEKPPPRTLCVCGLLQCSAGRMLRA